jgi:hypothetical protein
MRRSSYDMLLRAELEEKFPTELRTIAHAEEAIDAVRVSARATDLLLNNELQELGQLPVDPGQPEFARTRRAGAILSTRVT